MTHDLSPAPSPFVLSLSSEVEGLSTNGAGAVPANGFSLIEALVALSILAIAAVGLVRATESHIDSTRAMESRAIAMWVAENRLAELEVEPGADGPRAVEMLGREWRVDVDRRGTEDPEIERVRIEVFDARGTSALAALDGFLDGRRG